jgi:putative peptidoglycan lipid II flippase
VRTITSTFYALQDTKTPVKIAICGVVINIMCSILLMGTMKHNGLAFANSIAATANFMLLFFFLRKKLGGIGTRRIVISFVKIGFAAAVMGGCGWFATQGELWTSGGHIAQKAIHLTIVILGCLGIYLFASYLLRIEEMDYLVRKVKEKIFRNRLHSI